MANLKTKKMVNIYVLIDPRNNDVFYIGATYRPLYKRLYEHVQNRFQSLTPKTKQYTKDRQFRIQSIINDGFMVEIKTLVLCSEIYVNDFEKYMYNLFLLCGCKLHQVPVDKTKTYGKK